MFWDKTRAIVYDAERDLLEKKHKEKARKNKFTFQIK